MFTDVNRHMRLTYAQNVRRARQDQKVEASLVTTHSPAVQALPRFASTSGPGQY